MLLPNLYQYSDYRQFLRDCYASNKALHRSFSYRYLAQRAGVNSSAFFKYIMEGTRNLSKGTLLKTCQALGLKDRDAEYFENLVFFNQAKTVKEKNLYFDRLTRLRGAIDAKRLNPDQHAFYEQWYHSAIRELLGFAPRKGDPETLASLLSPSITPRQARESVELLRGLGLIRKDAQGHWSAVDPVITSGDPMASQTLVNFQLKMLDLVREAYDRWKPEERMMASTTFSISPEMLELFRKKIRQLRAELLDLARNDERPDRVFQLTMNLFPLSKSAKG
jgi:uncharacterized protein (TIGR02147 family)